MFRKFIIALAVFIGLAVASVGSAQAQSWNQVSNFTPSGGPIATSAAPGAVSSFGWNDVTGNTWFVTSGNLLQANNVGAASPWNTAVLLRQNSEAQVDGRDRITFVANAINTNGIYMLGRFSQSGGNTNAYMLGFTGGTTLKIYKVVSGTATVLITGTAFTQPTAGGTYVLDCNWVQTNGTTTTLTCNLYQSNGSTLISNVSTTDTTAGLQNVSASPALVTYIASSSSGAQMSNLITYNDLSGAATAYSLTGPSSGQVSVASTIFTVTTNGSLSSGVTVTPSDSAGGGTFAPTTVALSSGTLSGSFTYTPASTGTKSISTTNTGGLTNPAPLSYLSTSLVTVPVNSSAFKFSPGNWKGDTGRGGSSYRQSWNNGAWFQVRWTASSSPTATILLPSTATSNRVSYFLNGALTDNVAATGNITLTPIPSSVNTLWVYLRNSTQAARWNNGVNTVQIQGLQIDSASSAGTADAAKPWAMEVGDSITEGIVANNGSDDHLVDYSFNLGQALEQAGYDYDVTACGYSGWITVGDSTGDVPAWYKVASGTYNDAASRWNKIDSGVSLLDTNGQFSSYGATGTPPALIFVNYMTNEELTSASTSDAQASVTQFLTAARAAAPAAKIVVMIPFGLQAPGFTQSYVTALQNGVTAYQTANPSDTNVKLLNLGAAFATTITQTQYMNGGATGVHPNVAGHSLATGPVVQGVFASLLSGIANRWTH